MGAGLCRDRWYLFDGEGGQAPQATAVALCAACPVLTLCRDYARRVKPEAGIWAGIVRRPTEPRPDRET